MNTEPSGVFFEMPVTDAAHRMHAVGMQASQRCKIEVIKWGINTPAMHSIVVDSHPLHAKGMSLPIDIQ